MHQYANSGDMSEQTEEGQVQGEAQMKEVDQPTGEHEQAQSEQEQAESASKEAADAEAAKDETLQQKERDGLLVKEGGDEGGPPSAGGVGSGTDGPPGAP